jgi:hypothetical protein
MLTKLKINNQGDSQAWDIIRDQVSKQVGYRVWDQVKTQVWDQALKDTKNVN